jgi:hypothetical protein
MNKNKRDTLLGLMWMQISFYSMAVLFYLFAWKKIIFTIPYMAFLLMKITATGTFVIAIPILIYYFKFKKELKEDGKANSI